MKTNYRIPIQSNMNLPFMVFFFFALVLVTFSTAQLSTKAATDNTKPIISNINPTDNSYTKSPKISGTVSDDVDLPENLIIEIYENNQLIGLYNPNDVLPDSITLTSTGQNNEASWSFSYNFSESSHALEIRAIDSATNTATMPLTFTFDKTRPIILPTFTPKEDMTKVPINSSVTISLRDNILLKNLNPANSIIISSSVSGDVAGAAVFDEPTQTITFTPTSSLLPKTTYFVYTNPALADKAGNLVFPRMWKFTTMATDNVEDPHGNYTSNVNTCINCHNTHVATSSSLETPQKYQKDPAIDNYCMACHDGTVSPPPDKHNKSKKHDFQLDLENPKITGSCTSCHNPHLTWSETNPNLLSDHYTYDHPNHQPPFSVDSENQLCESCHESFVQWTVEQKQLFRNSYKIYHYRKITDAIGKAEDYSLCLRCHNGIKTTSNIEIYYNDKDSMHRITAMDGSPLVNDSNTDPTAPSSGNIPCADCHETHGSDNFDLLKGQFGHENITNEPFSTRASTEWTPTLERKFCQKCHNGSTAIYGVTTKAPPEGIPAHTDESKSCALCHGGASQSFMEAAHAPKKTTNSP